MLSILSTLIPVFGIIVLGIVVERKAFLPVETSVCLNQFVYWIGLPFMLFNQLARIETVSPALVWGILGSTIFVYLFAYWGFRLCSKKSMQESTVFALLSSFPNSAFMGLPIVMLLLPGDGAALITAGLGAVLNISSLLFADGRLELGRKKEGANAWLYLFRSLYRNPLLMASLLGICVGFLGIRIPKPLLAMSSMLGSTSAPCALFCMGMILSVQMTSSRGFVKGWVRRQFPLHVLKLVFQPLATFLLLYVLGVRGMYLAVSTLIAAMPTGVAAYIIAEKYQAATEDASLGIIVDTALSALTIPATVLLLQWQGML